MDHYLHDLSLSVATMKEHDPPPQGKTEGPPPLNNLKHQLPLAFLVPHF